ncbi:efflux RND transporter periplasmic adaptor subunit [Paludifilum halophilum]|uniref:RND efflux pump membrane fusion protein barrel-sandwich domain-containing protein n=1 Tax=Paludifilum halophilum TaxID=1642702 RepID=A0A235B3N5_9BACL|nr:HlyD family efflux transporter periplasmic adaptor subunit [Paludifilum halophilum]OYD06579.1 hypothetical protein CHM34_15920 [Paludifilum halophilum]
MNKKAWIGLGLAVLIVGMVSVYVLQNRTEAAEVNVTQLEKAEIREEVTTSGTLAPKERENIYDRRERGQLDEVRVERDEKVEEGDTILQYKNPYGKVKSTMDGTVIQVNEIDPTGASNRPVVVIADLDQQVIQAEVSEYDALKVKEGQPVTLQWDADPDRKWRGEVERVSRLPKEQEVEATAGSDDRQVMYPIEIRLEKKIPLKLGSRLMAVIETDNQKVDSLPQSALIRRGKQEGVYLIKQGRAAFQEVKVGITDGERVEIRSGLDPEDRVIIDPPEDLKNGSEVTVR